MVIQLFYAPLFLLYLMKVKKENEKLYYNV